MTLAWIAAALNPADVAPHPNFMSSERITPAGLFALLVQTRIGEFDRMFSSLSDGDRLNTPPAELEVVEAARQSIDAESCAEGAARLFELSDRTELDASCAVAAALLATVVYAELDRQRTAINALERLIDQLPAIDSSTRLHHALLRMQLALRRLELGELSTNDAKASLALLQEVRPSDLQRFQLSKGVGWRSGRTMRLIIEELQAVADLHIARSQMDPSSNEWTRFVRARPPELSLLIRRNAESGFSKYVSQLFDAHTLSTGKTYYFGDPVETPIYAALLHYELAGDSQQVNTWRTTLARLRVLRESPPEYQTWARQDAIRLFRQAGDTNSLDRVLSATRAGGPLRAIAGDARQIISERLQPHLLRRGELAVLAASAHLLTVDEASRALDGVLQSIDADVPALTVRWEDPSVRQEVAWRAAIDLAARIERIDEVALLLLQTARTAPPEDTLITHALSRSATRIAWETTDDATRGAWLSWFARSTSPVAATLAATLAPMLEAEGSSTLNQAPLQHAAWLLNQVLRTNTIPEGEDLDQLQKHVADILLQEQQAVASGRTGHTTLSPIDIAVGLVLYAGATTLWSPIVKFLLDPGVSREYKERPIERLAQNPDALPSIVRRQISARMDDLLRLEDPHEFDNATATPFPAALRLAVTAHFVDDDRQIAELSKLAGSRNARSRVEAAKTLALSTRTEKMPQWVPALVLQMSYDDEPIVRAEAGRGVASLLRSAEAHQGAFVQRTLELLSEDGLLVPLLALRGLQTDRVPSAMPELVVGRVKELASEHLALGVRLQAQALLVHSEFG